MALDYDRLEQIHEGARVALTSAILDSKPGKASGYITRHAGDLAYWFLHDGRQAIYTDPALMLDPQPLQAELNCSRWGASTVRHHSAALCAIALAAIGRLNEDIARWGAGQ